MCVCVSVPASVQSGDMAQAVGRGQGGLPASGGRAGPRRSGSPRTSKCGVQEGEGWGPAHPPPEALPQHSGPQGNLGQEQRAPGRRGRAGWAREKGCWLRRLCAAGAKGQEKEKPEQRRFFLGERGSREGRRPGKKKGGREMKQSGGAGNGAIPQAPPGPSHPGTKSEASLTRPQAAGPLPPPSLTHHISPPAILGKSLLVWPWPWPSPRHLLATFSTSCPPARLPRGFTVMTTPSVSQSSAGAPAAPTAPVASGWMPSRPCSSAMSRSWEGVLLRVAGSSRRRGEGSRDMGCAWPVSRLLLITERIWGGGEGKLSLSHSGLSPGCSVHTQVPWAGGEGRTRLPEKSQAEVRWRQGAEQTLHPALTSKSPMTLGRTSPPGASASLSLKWG